MIACHITGTAMRQTDWYHVSSHGAVLFCIAADPGCTVADLADSLCLTRRTIWGIVGDLRRAGMLEIRKNGRIHHYCINLDAPLRLRFLKDRSLRDIMGRFVEQASRRNNGNSTVSDTHRT